MKFLTFDPQEWPGGIAMMLAAHRSEGDWHEWVEKHYGAEKLNELRQEEERLVSAPFPQPARK